MSNYPYTTFEQVRLNDSTVQKCCYENLPYEEIIVILANQKAMLTEQLLRLESIAPRKFQLADGKVMIWHCPDHLVPMRHLGQ